MKKLNQTGQGITEYVLIIALIAVAVISSIKMFGTKEPSGLTTSNGLNGASNQVTQTSGH